MTRYHFHVHNGQDYPDEHGTELPHLEGVQAHALKTLAELIREKPDMFWKGEALSLRVTDSSDLALFTLYLSVTKAPAMLRSRPN